MPPTTARRPRGLDELSPPGKAIAYLLLGFWTFVVLFPLYWLAITSFKLPLDVNEGPFYLPFIDFQPSLDAWKYLFGTMLGDTLRPYRNTMIVALLSSAISLAVGTMAAYALVRLTYRPRVGAILGFVPCLILAVAAVAALGVPVAVAIVAALAVFALLLLTLGRRMQRALGNDDIAFWMVSQRILPPVTVVVPVYVVFQHLGLLDTRTALVITYVAVNVPIVVWLMRDFLTSIPLELEDRP